MSPFFSSQEKQQRMRDVYNFYYNEKVEGSAEALSGIWKWNGGDGSSLGAECKQINVFATPDTANKQVCRYVYTYLYM